MTCDWCGEPVLAGERADIVNADFHRECAFRMVAGSAAHLLGECWCCGGTRHDPPNMSKRAAAQFALEVWRIMHGS